MTLPSQLAPCSASTPDPQLPPHAPLYPTPPYPTLSHPIYLRRRPQPRRLQPRPHRRPRKRADAPPPAIHEAERQFPHGRVDGYDVYARFSGLRRAVCHDVYSVCVMRERMRGNGGGRGRKRELETGKERIGEERGGGGLEYRIVY